MRAGRARSAARILLRLPQGREGHRGGLARRLVPHRRRGARAARRRAALRRPAQEHHPPRRREHRRARGRGGARGPSGGRAGRGDRRAGPVRDEEVMACVVCERPDSRARHSRVHPGLVPRAPRLLQGARAMSPSSTSCRSPSTNKVQKAKLADFAIDPTNASTCASAKRPRKKGLRGRGGRGARHGALCALFDPRGALVAGPGLSELLKASGSKKGRHRRPHRVQLHACSRHSHRPHPTPWASRRDGSTTCPRRRERRGGAAARGARGAVGRRERRRLPRRRHQPRRFLPPDARQFQPVRARRGVSLRRRRPERELRLPHQRTTCATPARGARTSASCASRSAPTR